VTDTRAPAGYDGFFAPVASRVHPIDTCFGEFIDYLKARHVYDDSVVILTSDHGDSLGEDGRWGHAYTVFPEVMRVPLIVHLPKAIAAAVTTDLSAVTFSADIAPSLYRLLGYEPADRGPLYGAPLFSGGDELRNRRRDPFLLSSSYGAVYGMLRHNGRELYIADAIGGRDYAFDLADEGHAARVDITPAMRSLNRTLIRQQIAAIGAEYHFASGQQP
jgi:arylsulfatase A-like enzyme